MIIRNIGLLSIAIALGIACGGTTPPPGAGGQTAEQAPSATTTAPTAVPTTAEAAAAPAPSPSVSAEPVAKAWKDKTKDEKLAIMKTVVMPKMKELFQAHDAKEFKDFTCATCHGAGAKEGKFDMPNPKLPKLSFKDHFAKHMKADPKITKFMMEKVVPEMSTALGVQVFDPKTNVGFGCAGCHVVAE